jgi:5-methylcytosine-specific restriction endonuclease McrA
MTAWNGPEHWAAPSRDHRIPRSRGGRNVLENIDVICRRCNADKGNMTREEFLERSPLRRSDTRGRALGSKCAV